MASSIAPKLPGLPPTTGIQDPAARRFAEAVSDSLRVIQGSDFVVSQLNQSASSGGTSSGTVAPAITGGTPAFISRWLASSSAYQALKQGITKIALQASDALAGLVQEKDARTVGDTTLASAINTMWAITGANQAISQSGSNLVSNWTASQASYWSTLNAEVFTSGGQTIRAALKEEADARATLAGDIQATWTVRVDAGGYIAGVGLGVEGGPGGVTSSFIIRADKFAMVMPGYGEYVPFAIGPTGVSFSGATSWAGVTGSGRPADNATVGAVIGQNLGGTFTAQNIAAYMPAAVIGQAQIQNAAIGQAQIQAAAVGRAQIQEAAIGYANIGDAEIGTLKVAGDAITVAVGASGNQVAQIVMAVPSAADGRPLIVWMSASPSGSYTDAYLEIDGVRQATLDVVPVATPSPESGGGGINMPMSKTSVFNIGAGVHVIRLYGPASVALAALLGKR